MERSEIEHICVIPGSNVTFRTTCACGTPNHTLTISVSKNALPFKNGNTSIGIDMEMFFEVFWSDRSDWDDKYTLLLKDHTRYEAAVAWIKQRLSFFRRMWNRVRAAWKILVRGEIKEEGYFLFRSGEQAEAVYRAMGDAVALFRNAEKEVDELCDKYKNITKCRYFG